MRRPRTDATRRFYVAVGEKITNARLRLGISQEALAADIQLTRTAVVNIEHGKQQLLLHTLLKISQALKVPVTALLADVPKEGTPVLEVVKSVIDDRKAREWVQSRLKSSDMERN